MKLIALGVGAVAGWKAPEIAFKLQKPATNTKQVQSQRTYTFIRGVENPRFLRWQMARCGTLATEHV